VAFVNGHEVILACGRSLRAEHARLALEQAVRNIDALDERAVQEVLEAGFFEQGLGVLREQHYPSLWRLETGRRSVLQRDSERARCDFVITERPGMVLADRLREAREIETDVRLASGTLFEPVAGRVVPVAKKKRRGKKKLVVEVAEVVAAGEAGEAGEEAAPAGVGDQLGGEVRIGPDDAYWLEIKVVGQVCFRAGVPRANEAYASEIVGAACDDVIKLGRDGEIVRGGALVVLMCADRKTALHDLGVAAERCMGRGAERGVTVRSPLFDGFEIEDRIGNRWCGLGLFEPGGGGGRSLLGS